MASIRQRKKFNRINLQPIATGSKRNIELNEKYVHLPWCIEFNEGIFIIVGNNIFEILGNSNGYWTIVIGWDWFGFQVWFEFAGFQIVDECLKVVNSIIY